MNDAAIAAIAYQVLTTAGDLSDFQVAQRVEIRLRNAGLAVEPICTLTMRRILDDFVGAGIAEAVKIGPYNGYRA